jgi:predicted RNA-binding protein with RPS1 domain
VFAAEVVDVKDFGAVVKIARAQEALLHVSELSHDAALLKKPVSELLAVGQRLEVQVWYSTITSLAQLMLIFPCLFR